MSGASVFKFKGKTKDLQAIAKTLHVKALLVDGSSNARASSRSAWR